MTIRYKWKGSINPDDKSGTGVFLVSGIHTEPIKFESFADFQTICSVIDKHMAIEYQRGRMDVSRLVKNAVGETK